MRIIALIPARLESTRLPNKLLLKIKEMSIISLTYQNVVQSGLFDEVAVVTDSLQIQDELKLISANVYFNQKSHESGTDRIAEFAHLFSDEDIIVNVQGDEPFLKHKMLEQLIDLMKKNHQKFLVGTLMHEIDSESDIQNPNNVKVVTAEDGRALFFSRATIPYPRDNNVCVKYYKHIGIYAFTKEALLKFSNSKPSKLEMIEKLENLRFLELGIPVYVSESPFSTIGIDTIEDYNNAKLMVNKN